MRLGVIISLTDEIETEFDKLRQMGFETCQLNCWEASRFSWENARRITSASRQAGVTVTAFWCGWSGPAVWDLVEGPLTLGLVPPVYRYQRLQTLMQGAQFSASIGVKSMVTHVGFIPEDPNLAEYPGVVSTLRYLAGYCRSLGVDFLFETGQETPVTLLRTIEDIGMENVGVNLDPANLVLYGKANPVDAMDVIGKYVRGVHAKDGRYPTTGRLLGEETPLGQGKVDFPKLVARLKDVGYDGALTIEREISGEQQIRDIQMAKTFLESLL
jgi:L-ribulose-5-phosphate 3-epimerase